VPGPGGGDGLPAPAPASPAPVEVAVPVPVTVVVAKVVSVVVLMVMVVVMVLPKSRIICSEVVMVVVIKPIDVSGFWSFPRVSKEPMTWTPPSNNVVVSGPDGTGVVSGGSVKVITWSAAVDVVVVVVVVVALSRHSAGVLA